MATTAPETPAAREMPEWLRGLRAFRHYNYRLYFSGQLISQIGTWMQNIAQGWLVLRLTNSAFDLGFVTALQGLPILFFVLLGGVVADRVPKYRLMVFTQSVMAILALILALDVTAGTVRIWHVYILAALLGIANAANIPSQQALAVEMVGQEDLLSAVALNSAQFNTSRIVGPAVAGVLIAVVGMALCFYLNALSFLAVIAGLLLMRPSEFRVAGRVQRGGSFRGQLAAGVGFVRRMPLLLTICVLGATVGTFAFNTNVIIPLFADKVLRVGPEGYGLMTSAMGLGSVLAAVTLSFGSRARASLMAGGISAYVFCSLVLAASRFLPLSLLVLCGMGASAMAYSTQANTTLQVATPDALRGRVVSLYMMLFGGSQPIGAFITGILAARLGAPRALATDVIICGLVLAGVLIYSPSRRGIQTPPELALERAAEERRLASV